MEITRHFTASTYVVYENTVLLHFHRKLLLWLPLGGHIDRDELPEEAAIRETKEESGLDIVLYKSESTLSLTKTKKLISPVHVLLEDINPFHQHIDFIYYATTKFNSIFPQEGESNTLKWFTKEDLQKQELLDNVYACALESLELLNSENMNPQNIY